MTPVRHSSRTARRGAVALAAATVVLGLALSGCAGSGGDDSATASKEVTIVVHDSFPKDDFERAASEATGYDVKVVSAGDGGELTNKLVLTKGAPIADAFFGVDNIFGSRLADQGVTEPYTPERLPAGAEDFALDDTGSLTAVDLGATCVNVDTAWFADRGLAEPASYRDLAKPEYRDLTVLLDPTASSTGASFLVGTVAEFGEDGFADYWQSLVDNGARIEQGWSDAYYGQFTQGGGSGTRPIVVSYASSPAFTANDAGTESATRALLDTCSNQIEYAGVLKGAANPEGAKAVVDYLVSEEFQATIPDSMYMYPVDSEVAVPEAWAKFAPMPSREQAHDLPAAEIDRGREGWLRTLGDRIGL